MTSIPPQYICPITQSIMMDPVIAGDGYTYEREFIVDWLQTHGNSPMTREHITLDSLKPNRALLDLIEEFRKSVNIDELELLPARRPTDTLPQPPQLNESTIPETEMTFIEKTCIAKSDFDGKLYRYQKRFPANPNTADKRIPTTFICLIDVSGSMGIECSIQSKGESDGLTRLDLTKHSLNTIIEILNDSDELILIKFTTSATLLYTGHMTIANKHLAKQCVRQLQPENSTNIWAALQLGFQQAQYTHNPTNTRLLLLSDGESNMNPPMGILSALDRVLRKPENVYLQSIPITTFGFSNEVDSKLLYEIASRTRGVREGTTGIGGGFNFIPDASMVGTSFIHYLANGLTTHYTTYTITGYDPTATDADAEVEEEVDEEVRYELLRYQVAKELQCLCYGTHNKERILSSAMMKRLSQLTSYVLHWSQTSYPHCVLGQALVKDFISSHTINDIDGNSDSNSDNDSEGQITKAVSRSDWFASWGYHYLLSLSSAHTIRQCHNFMDRGVQGYGNGNVFEELCELGNDIFIALPPPIPSIHTTTTSTTSTTHTNTTYTNTHNATSAIDMSRYVNAAAGCFSPYAMILLTNGSIKPLYTITSDDILVTNHDGNDHTKGKKVKYLVKLYPPEGNKGIEAHQNMIRIPTTDYHSDHSSDSSDGEVDLVISPYHPIYCTIQQQWIFPIHHPLAQSISHHEYRCDCVMNVVLDNNDNSDNSDDDNDSNKAYSIIVNGMECVTWGHNCHYFPNANGSEILEHAFFGTNRVIEAIEQFLSPPSSSTSTSSDKPSWLVEVKDYQVVRSSESDGDNKVIGFQKCSNV